MYAQRAWDSFSLHLSSVKTQGICNTLSKAVRHYALEKKRILQRCMTKKVTKEPHIVAVNCVHFRLTGQVTSGLRWEDLGHYRSRQSCFGQRRLDGPEPASPCKGKINVVTLADLFMFYSVQLELWRVSFTDTARIIASHSRLQTLANLGNEKYYHTGFPEGGLGSVPSTHMMVPNHPLTSVSGAPAPYSGLRGH